MCWAREKLLLAVSKWILNEVISSSSQQTSSSWSQNCASARLRTRDPWILRIIWSFALQPCNTLTLTMWSVFAIYFAEDRGPIVLCDSSAKETMVGWTSCQNWSSARVCVLPTNTQSRNLTRVSSCGACYIFILHVRLGVQLRTHIVARREESGVQTENISIERWWKFKLSGINGSPSQHCS